MHRVVAGTADALLVPGHVREGARPTRLAVCVVTDHDHLKSILGEYTRRGFKTAIDDFGAGYSGLNLLAEFQPDIIKLDMALLRNIDSDPVRQAIVRGILGVCQALNIEVIAEGVETVAELTFLRGIGVYLFQGYLLARPAYEQIPDVDWSKVPA